jgi:hypothetical protein
MTATRLDITIDQGADYEQPFFVVDSAGKPVDISGAAAAMQIRTAIGDPTALVTLTTAGGTLTINGPAGTITPSIDAASTTALTPGTYVYDLKMLDTHGLTSRTHQGNVTVTGEVTVIDVAPAPSPTPSNAITGEDGITPLTGEDGTTTINQES